MRIKDMRRKGGGAHEQGVTLILPPSNYKFDEAMKTLRTNLIFCGSSVRTVMFTSTQPNEGKSEVAFSLAASMAQMGKKVLFVDTDIRKIGAAESVPSKRGGAGAVGILKRPDLKRGCGV